MSYEIRSDKHWRISKSGYSIKTGFTDSTRIVASYHAPHGKFDARRFEQWLEDAQHACDLHNASIDGADELERLRAPELAEALKEARPCVEEIADQVDCTAPHKAASIYALLARIDAALAKAGVG